MTKLQAACGVLICASALGAMTTDANAFGAASAPRHVAELARPFGHAVQPAAHTLRRALRKHRRVRAVVVDPFPRPVGVVPPVVPRHELYPAYGYPYLAKRRR